MTSTARFAVIAAPLAMAGYGVARLIGRLDDSYGPGFDWQLAHFLGLAGLLLFVPLVLGMRQLVAAGPAREVAVAVTLAGLAASIVQFGADIVQAFLAADRAELRSLQSDFSGLPGVQAAVYDFGPLCFYLGVVALAALVAQAGRLPWWSPALLLAAVLLPAVTLDLMPLSGLLMLVALLPLRREPVRPRAGAVAA
jgi:hypothetical protein